MRGASRYFIAAILMLAATATALVAQAVATASGPGSFVAVGGGLSTFNSDYGHRAIAGGLVYADVNPQWRVSLEGEARFLRWHTFEDVTQSNYLGGVRVAVLRPRRWNPYMKFVAGVGRVTLPFPYAHASFLAYAPGAGLEVAVNDRVSVRVLDVEYQHWPQFPFGALSPYGISTGVSMRLFLLVPLLAISQSRSFLRHRGRRHILRKPPSYIVRLQFFRSSGPRNSGKRWSLC